MINKLDIVAIRSDDGKFYLCERSEVARNAYDRTCLLGYLVNGKQPVPTFHKSWVRSDSEPKRITRMVSQPDTNHRYELLDKELVLPEFIDRDAVAVYEDCEWKWVDEMSKYRSMYTLICDEHPDKEEEIPFSMEIALTVSEVTDPIKMAYHVQERRESGTVSEDDVIYQLVDQVIVPGILLPKRPCRLSSQATYKIVRQYIKDNIDTGVAQITSDYNFCFTVKRRIRLARVVEYTADVNDDIFSKRKRKPKYVKKQKSERLEQVFEMTYSPYNYKGYTPISGFEANSQAELKGKIDAYCKDIVDFINVALVECDKCHGDGLILPEQHDRDGE